jgi:hypothetical protein
LQRRLLDVQRLIATLRAQETPRRNSVGHADSVEKILAQISLLTPDTVRYIPTTPAGRILQERRFDTIVNAVVLTPSLFRRFVCVSGCTACCQKFTLDYVPSEMETMVKDRTGFVKRTIWVNGKEKWVWTNDQNHNPICDFLTAKRPDGGLGCAHWPAPPLSCISAPQLQFIQMRPGKTFVLKKPFGRAWAMTPTPQCKFEPVESIAEMDLDSLLSILDRFSEWARYFGIKTKLTAVKKGIRDVQRTGLVPVTGLPVWEAE